MHNKHKMQQKQQPIQKNQHKQQRNKHTHYDRTLMIQGLQDMFSWFISGAVNLLERFRQGGE
jgi:hypothetical protein